MGKNGKEKSKQCKNQRIRKKKIEVLRLLLLKGTVVIILFMYKIIKELHVDHL